jgi:preprotein translocase subunit SecY
MIRKLVSIFKNKELRERIIFTLGIILIFRFGCTLVVPGVDSSSITFSGSDIFTLMNVLGGGNLQSFSLFALGISPYITASIIIQLLSMGILPKLEDLAAQGEKGRKKLDNATRYLTLLLAAVQGYGTILVMKNNYGLTPIGGGEFSTWDYIYITTILVAGSMFTMWLADRITSRGIGNGVSMVIFAGIIASIPNQLLSAYYSFVNLTGTSSEMFTGFVKLAIYALSYLLVIIFVVFIEKSVRKIPLQNSQNTMQVRATDIHHLPVKLNPSGVMPVIFASSFMMAIVTIASMFPNSETAIKIASIFNYSTKVDGVYWGLIIYIVLIVMFNFFWTNMQMDSKKISENLVKRSAFVPGIRQGRETEKYLFRVINRVAFVGGLLLVAIAVLPVLLPIYFDLDAAIAFGGTSIIILVGVASEIYEQIKSKLASKEYKGFM